MEQFMYALLNKFAHSEFLDDSNHCLQFYCTAVALHTLFIHNMAKEFPDLDFETMQAVKSATKRNGSVVIAIE